MATQPILDSLEAYTGELDSLNAFIQVAEQELGQNWTDEIYNVLDTLSTSQKEKLDHAFNYYAATTAWNEIQSYLSHEGPLNYQETVERIPVLEHWLSFFGAAGEEVIAALNGRLKSEGIAQAQDTSVLDEPFAVSSSRPVSAQINQEASSMQETPMVNQAEYGSIPQNIEEEITADDDIQERIDDIFSNDSLPEESNDLALTAEETSDIFPSHQESSSKNTSDETDMDAFFQAVRATDSSYQTPSQSMIQEDSSETLLNVSVAPNVVAEAPHELSRPLEDPQIQQRSEPVDALIEVLPQPQIQPALQQPRVPVQQSTQSQVQQESQPSQRAPLMVETEQEFQVSKVLRQIEFKSAVQAWVSARCYELGYTNNYTYRYYGFLVDIMDKTIEEIKILLADATSYDTIEQKKSNGVHFLQNQLISLEKDSKDAHERIMVDLSPLPREGLSTDDVRRALGQMDGSEEKEYLGPAPDGFEVLEDPYENMDETALKKQYAKIEADADLPPAETAKPVEPSELKKPITAPKSASQTPQNGVQRKMAFSFGKKPATGTADS